MLKGSGERMSKNKVNGNRRFLIFTMICLALCAFQSPAQVPGGVRSRSSMRSENGLQRLLFSFPEGRLVVNLPDDIRPGDTISGTVVSEPAGADAGEKAKNRNVLEGYVIDFGGAVKVKADKPGFKWIPQMPSPGAPNRYLFPIYIFAAGLTDPAAGLNVVLSQDVTPALASFVLPTIGQTGRPLSISGPFDGDASNTKCTIGSAPCEVIAESPRKVVVSSPVSTVGQTTISVIDGKNNGNGAFRNIGINLSAPKTSLLKGEKTTVTIQISGLDGIAASVPVQVVTTGVVNMDGGNNQVLDIRPAQVRADGTFRVNKEITGTQAGSFNVTATVLSP